MAVRPKKVKQLTAEEFIERRMKVHHLSRMQYISLYTVEKCCCKYWACTGWKETQKEQEASTW